MIFNETYSSNYNYSVEPSPYELGIGGALMHVYENECNYNALMKAAALSELKYYNETGMDLFVHEAGAFSSLVSKVKEFFKKVIEKIKSIFHKFMAVINQYTKSDKDFVKKYGTELTRKNLTDFEFDGYKFPGANTVPEKYDNINDCIKSIEDNTSSDDLEKIIETNRASILKKSGAKYTESEFRDELKDHFYGDKENLEVGKQGIRTYLNIISESKESIKNAEKAQRDRIKEVDDIVKLIEKSADSLSKYTSNKKDTAELKKGIEDYNTSKSTGMYDFKNTDASATEVDTAVKKWDNQVKVGKAFSSDLTIYFGAYVGALKDKNRQAKAICIKALQYKYAHESASYYGGGYNGNIFSNVEII